MCSVQSTGREYNTYLDQVEKIARVREVVKVIVRWYDGHRALALLADRPTPLCEKTSVVWGVATPQSLNQTLVGGWQVHIIALDGPTLDG